MTEAVADQVRKPIGEMVRDRVAQIQGRLGEMQTDARGRISRALTTGNLKLRELDETLARVSRDDWTIESVRRHIEQLRARAESARATALKRVAEMPGTAVEALAAGTRTPLQTLSNRLAEIAKRIDGGAEAPNGEKPKAANGK